MQKKGNIMTSIGINKFVLTTGERYCIIMDNENKAPLFYPNLYLTIKLRNRGCSVLTMEAAALTLSLFYRFLRENNISIDERILHNRFISNSEIDRLFIFLTKKRSRRIRSPSISKLTLYHRLNTIAGYLLWLSETLYRYDTPEINILNAEKMVRSIKERKPRIPKRQDRTYENDGIAENVIKIIMDVIDPHSNSNPFEIYVRQRNEILVLMLYELGVRCGELLNIKTEDIDFQKNRIRIKRRADEINDSRINQPLVKTLSRTVSLDKTMALKIYNYIVFDRSKLSKGNDGFLFLSYKPGPTQGNPLSMSAYHKIISKISLCDPLLNNLRGHQFRHTWNYNFSKLMDSMPTKVSENQQEKMRERLMGWKENSGTASIYNKRFINEKANEASLRLQERLNKTIRRKDENK